MAFVFLVVLAHSDDESFPLGGTLARYAAQGARNTLVCARRGEKGIPCLSPRRQPVAEMEQ
jgi:LmbE family N-acetylglucosaminyl deacetylase